ncbi:PCNA-associated factor-like [Nylanderia fulva]|uniref:PCNA-associated factor-like n=1 Tax=Nylanderia fulva TaxID=613905 RepID=UPI0010FBB06D|nr:PCNA-associated factor-like [Nylanderia fulva]
MVRTKADRVPTKAVGGKAPGKIRAANPGKSNGKKSAGKSSGGGNPYHPRETPEWQKPITSFINVATSSTTTTDNKSKDSQESGIAKAKEKIENQVSNFEDPNAEEDSTEEEDDDETD